MIATTSLIFVILFLCCLLFFVIRQQSIERDRATVRLLEERSRFNDDIQSLTEALLRDSGKQINYRTAAVRPIRAPKDWFRAKSDPKLVVPDKEGNS